MIAELSKAHKVSDELRNQVILLETSLKDARCNEQKLRTAAASSWWNIFMCSNCRVDKTQAAIPAPSKPVHPTANSLST